MTEQSLNKEISTYIGLLSPTQKSSLLSFIKSFFSTEEKTTKRISKKQYNKEIDAAVKRIANGQFLTQEEAEKEMDKW